MSETPDGSTESMVKVLLAQADPVESVWAIGQGNDFYQLDNSPFFAYGLSWHDVVEARPPDADHIPEYVQVVKKSGHRTIRLKFEAPVDEHPEFQWFLNKLKTQGCSYEGLNKRYFAVDIPPELDLESVRVMLISSGYMWEHADPTYEDLFGPDVATDS